MIEATKDISAASKYAVVVKSDTTRHYPPLKVLWLPTGGDLHVKAPGVDTVVVLSGVPAGRFTGFMIEHIMAATTVTGNIVGGWD